LSEDKQELIKQAARIRAVALKELCKRDPVFWLTNFAKTFDEHDKLNPVKPFPMRPYVAVVAKEWEQESILHVAKSRQMTVSWEAIALLLHEAQFYPYRLQAVFSKKEVDALNLVERAKFIYTHQPLWLRNLCPLDRKMRDMPLGNLFFEHGSKIVGFAQGKDQIRSYVPSTALLDEAAFQDKVEETYGACVPCCQKIILVSSANPGFFERLCELKPNEQYGPLTLTRNSQGHRVIRLHYTADPDKDSNWVKRESAKLLGGTTSLVWRREMEIDFGAGSGELVFPEFFGMEDDLVVDPFKLDDTYSYFGGFDWGVRNPASFHVYAQAQDGTIYSVWEYYAAGHIVPQVARSIRECPFYDKLQWIAADPSIWTENQSRKDGFTSIAAMMNDEDEVGEYIVYKIMPAHDRSDVAGIARVKALWGQVPVKFKIFKTCPHQISELKNLKYPERKERVNETEKILDKNNHTWDDFKYFLLSNPFIKTMEDKPKVGTIKYINEISDLAAERAKMTGRTIQEEFNELYGT
jgi:hypothetical protein